MGDMEQYTCEPVRVFDAKWLHQLEQGRVTWADEDAKVKL